MCDDDTRTFSTDKTARRRKPRTASLADRERREELARQGAYYGQVDGRENVQELSEVQLIEEGWVRDGEYETPLLSTLR